MNEDIAKGGWKQLKGKLKAKWGELTEDDLTQAEGNLDYLFGKLQSQYGYTRDEVQASLRELGLDV